VKQATLGLLSFEGMTRYFPPIKDLWVLWFNMSAFSSNSFSRSLVALLVVVSSVFSYAPSFAAPQAHVATPWQRGLQTPAAPISEGIAAFHDDIRIFLAGILCFVIYLLVAIFRRFSTRTPYSSTVAVDRLVHASTLEIVWTIVPALVLIVIAIPSFSLLYSVDEILEPLFTVKVIGHQWYWSYEFLDPEVIARLYNDSLSSADSVTFSAEGAGSFDSYRLSDEDVLADNGLSSIRLLTVDNHLFLPTERHVRARVTSADVLHSWAIPSLGVKLDACPGRLNQASIFIKREGLYYGQCSEICGVNHGFRPIGIASQEFFTGLTPTALDVEPLLAGLQALSLNE
jgi:cytochrome c oxidase subunit 2